MASTVTKSRAVEWGDLLPHQKAPAAFDTHPTESKRGTEPSSCPQGAGHKNRMSSGNDQDVIERDKIESSRMRNISAMHLTKKFQSWCMHERRNCEETHETAKVN